MKNRSGFSPQQGPSVWGILGWTILVALGIGLIWVGFVQPLMIGEKPSATEPSDSAALVPTPTTVLYPTFTPPPASPSPIPVPTDTPAPTAVPPTEALATPSIVAGDQGVNVRSGPGTSYTLQGYLEPGSEAEVTGRYSDWWQIRHNGGLGWVFGELVTASNADTVAQVEPPSAPTSAPVTAVPPTEPPPPTAAPVTDIQGLRPDDFQVEGAPGPYAVGQEIQFWMWITNISNSTVEYRSLGAVVDETNQYQQSYSYSEIASGEQFAHNDHIVIGEAGTYHLWLTIGFYDGAWVRMLSPVEVIVQ